MPFKVDPPMAEETKVDVHDVGKMLERFFGKEGGWCFIAPNGIGKGNILMADEVKPVDIIAKLPEFLKKLGIDPELVFDALNTYYRLHREKTDKEHLPGCDGNH